MRITIFTLNGAPVITHGLFLYVFSKKLYPSNVIYDQVYYQV